MIRIERLFTTPAVGAQNEAAAKSLANGID
jgi:hypothetical protein